VHQKVRRGDERRGRDNDPCDDHEGEHERDQSRGRRDDQQHEQQPRTEQQEQRRPCQGDEEDARHDSPQQFAGGGSLGRIGVRDGLVPRLFSRLLHQAVSVCVLD